MRVFFEVINLVFIIKIPSLRIFNSVFLNASYSTNKRRVKKTLRKALYLNIIIDKLNNWQHNRVLNLYINVIKLGFYYIKSQVLKEE